MLGGRYQPTTAVLFRDAIQSACGFAQSATGPFYCPADRKVYLDWVSSTSCTRASARRAISRRPTCSRTSSATTCRRCSASRRRCAQRQSGAIRGAERAVGALELQADCFAGVWGHTPTAAAAGVSSNRRPRRGAERRRGDRRRPHPADQAGRVAPERFTHGSSEQRVDWFRRGIRSGDPKACNTFQ